ncbi:MAG: IgGFc-binding protein [Myxococcota bacterium]|nr:IgGFc-binding protein [Myxococcota bacterium]MDW8361642.1 IgGFc-binding protein [Myxococcales bacterium]
MRGRAGPAALLASLSALLVACGGDGPADGGRPETGPPNPFVDGSFFCVSDEARACVGATFYRCERVGEFLEPRVEECAAHDPPRACVVEYGCVPCRPGARECRDDDGDDDPDVYVCRDDGSGWDLVEDCDETAGFACRDGVCRNLCAIAFEERSYVGCEFYAVDLDNAAIAVGRDASSQQFAVVVSNPGHQPTEVQVEIDEGTFGGETMARVIETVRVPPGDLEVLRLPRREVDGSSSNAVCLPDDRRCPGREVCVCSRGDREPPCLCRRSPSSTGMNDGTHTALSAAAYRIRSRFPIIAYQFNPLDNVGVFSNDASLLLPTSALGTRYTVVGWPQTIANGPVAGSDTDFDPSRTDEDLRAFLTIVGTSAAPSRVRIQLGMRIRQAVGIEAGTFYRGGEVIELMVGAFDVVNLETQFLNADFTGTRIESEEPVAVFVGSEASDAPRFDTYLTRQCCADHLEEQLMPDTSLGRRFIIARMPPRTRALNAAFVNPLVDSVPEVNEPEWVRVQSVVDRDTVLTTTLPAPDDHVVLAPFDSIIFRADQDFILEATEPVAVLQVMSSQEAVGIRPEYPGGDPAIVVVPPTEQYRQDYVFLTPDLYAFDFVTIMAPASARILLDGEPLSERTCTTSPADGLPRRPGDPPPLEVIYRCQFSFPDVIGLPNVRVEEGVQNDGVHTIVADAPVGIVVWGFDAFVSYGYAGGLNVTPLF